MAPLDGIRVLDLTRLLPGGFCTQLMADFGADVIKVEDTGAGDYIRMAPPYHEVEGDETSTRSGLYLSLNRSKRSIRLDLKSEAGQEAFMRLVGGADVVMEGFRPGVAERLGIDYESLSSVNPGIVCCSISGYGQTGPNVDRAGHDINYLAATGMLGLSGSADGPPVQPGGQIGDLGGGASMAAFGVMTALFEKQRTGEGQLVDISMTDGAMAWMAMDAGRFLADGEVPHRGAGVLNGGVVCYLTYEASDGWIACGALEPKFWKAFCDGVGRSDLIGHQFDQPGSEGHEKVAEVFRGRSKAEWKAFNDEADCCIEPILDIDEALASPQMRERGMVVEFEQPGIGKVEQLGNPVKLSRTPAGPPRAAPAIGEHTEEVLAEAGMSEAEIAALIESGAAAGRGGTAGGDLFRA